MPTREEIQQFIRIRQKRQINKKYEERRKEHMADSVLIECCIKRNTPWMRKKGK